MRNSEFVETTHELGSGAGILPARIGQAGSLLHYHVHRPNARPILEVEAFHEPKHQSRARKAGAAGFSLIEVVVAILILGIALVGLTEGVTSALSSSKASEVQTTAALLAAGQIETLRAEGDYTDGQTEGDFGDEFPQYQWKQTISDTDIDGLHDVDVIVEDSRTGRALYDLKTMLFELPQGTNTVNLADAGGSRFFNRGRRP